MREIALWIAGIAFTFGLIHNLWELKNISANLSEQITLQASANEAVRRDRVTSCVTGVVPFTNADKSVTRYCSEAMTYAEWPEILKAQQAKAQPKAPMVEDEGAKGDG